MYDDRKYIRFNTDQLSVTYTSFDKVSHAAIGDDEVSFLYGFNEERVRMTESYNTMERQKTYVANCEFITESESGIVTDKSWTFLTCPTGVFAVVEKEGNTETLHYILKDHQGSWTVVTDAEGTVEQELSYDAWGNLRDPDTWCVDTSIKPMFDRGYTGHEHLTAFGLVNMNGRMYDPVMSSFLSVDNFIQNPGNSQSFNRYSYCLNNPLKYTDPDGESYLMYVAAAYYLFFTESGYEFQKYVSQAAFHVNLHLSTEQIGLGFDASFGVPKKYPFSHRSHFGATYYWRHYDNSYQGWELRYGGEWTLFSLFNYSGTVFKSGETSQITNAITVGDYHGNLKYENDNMFDIGDYLPGVPNADDGDRFRTAAARIKLGELSVGINLFTGDPGLRGGDGGDRNTRPINGFDTYVIGNNGENPDEYRAGVFYVGLGSFKLGQNSEGIRNHFQNELVHKPGGFPLFKVLDIQPHFYFYFGSYTGNSLW